MARANRYYLPECVRNIIHRWHKKDFLLRFARDRQRWLQWLFEGKKRFRAYILNYAVTSNHIHLLVKDRRKREVILQTMQLIAGRTGQGYNRRKNRKGAFGGNGYHANTVEAHHHLIQGMVYMGLNMVRAGMVTHPSEWPFSGYNEIQNPRQTYSFTLVWSDPKRKPVEKSVIPTNPIFTMI